MYQLRGFWSYAHGNGVYADVYYQSMRDALKSSATGIVGIGSSAIFRDQGPEPDHSLIEGANWRTGIVENLGSALLFYCCQAPLWLSSPNCLFEYRMFRASLEEMARELASAGSEADVEWLADRLVIGVPFDPVPEDKLDEIIARSPWPHEIRSIGIEWNAKHRTGDWIIPSNSQRLLRGDEIHRLAHSFAIGRTTAITRGLRDALGALGGAKRVFEFLADRAAFRQAWLRQLEEVNAVPARPNETPAGAATDDRRRSILEARARRIERDLSIEMLVLPGDGANPPVLVGADAVSPACVPASGEWEVMFDTAGQPLWHLEDARAVAEILRDEGLIPPTADDVRRIGALAAGRGAARDLRWPANLWVRGEDGALRPLLATGAPLPLFVMGAV